MVLAKRVTSRQSCECGLGAYTSEAKANYQSRKKLLASSCKWCECGFGCVKDANVFHCRAKHKTFFSYPHDTSINM